MSTQAQRVNNPLSQFDIFSPNVTIPRNQRIKLCALHVAAGNIPPRNLLSMARFINRMPQGGASCTFAIRDHEIGQGASERDRPWTTSSRRVDHQAITIEMANSRNDSADWPCTDQTVQTTCGLIAECARFYGFDTVAFYNDPYNYGAPNEFVIFFHRWFANKSCPGPWVIRNIQVILDVCNGLLRGQNARFVSIDARTAQCVIDGVALEPAAPLPPPCAPAVPTQEFAVGDIVQFIGGPHFTSSTASSPAGTRTAGQARVTSITARGSQTVHLVGQPGGSNVHGWVDAKRVKPLTQTPTEPPRPQAPPPQQQTPPPATPPEGFQEFRIRSAVPVLNVRRGPGISNEITTVLINDRNVYTIVEERDGWGRLRSGVGWLSLQFTERV